MNIAGGVVLSFDKPARLTIRVLWFLFLIVKSEVKKQIGRGCVNIAGGAVLIVEQLVL